MNEKHMEWALCPICGAKTVRYDGPGSGEPAECRGVFVKCTRGCKGVYELVIREGAQVAGLAEKRGLEGLED